MRASLGLAVLALALLPQAWADHVPTSAYVIQLPDLGSGPAFACIGVATQFPVQVGPACAMWCFPDGACAVFFKDAMQRDLPFHVVYTDAATGAAVRVDPLPSGWACLSTWLMGDATHFTFHPDPFALPGQGGYANAVEDEGMRCIY